MKKERIKTKRGFRGIGIFIFGWFIGFISTFGIIIGIGYWAYSSISVRRIEKWTKTEITDNKGIEDLTLKSTVAIIQGITSSDSDAYTLTKLEEDFGIDLLGESIYGISTDIIKNSPIKNLKQAIDDTIDTATFNNVLNFMGLEKDELGLLDTILETEHIYYVYENKLYTTEQHNIEVEFDYTIESDVVKFANGSHTIFTTNGIQTIKPRLSDLPLNTALRSITDTTKQLQIYEILDYTREGTDGNYTYKDNGKDVTGIMKSIAGFTIDELSTKETLNNIYIYEVMDYKSLGNGNYTYINTSNQEVAVTGAMKTIAGKTIGELSDPNTINNLYIYEIMGYDRTGEEGNYSYTDQGEPVAGAMKALAGKTISELSNSNTINNLYVYEIMGYDRTGEEGSYSYVDNGNDVTGIMATLAGKKISELETAGAFDDVTIADALGYTISEGGVYDKNNNKVEGVVAHLADAKVSGLSARIDSLTIGKVLDIEESAATGVVKALYGTTIDNLQTKLDTITLGEALGLELDETSGVLKALHGTEIDQLETEIKALTLGKALDIAEGDANGIVKALYGVKITELKTEIDNLTLGKALGIAEGDATGVLKALYNSKINELNTDISDLQVYEIMGYTRSGEEGSYTYSNGGSAVTGIMRAIAGSKVNDLGSTIEGLKAKDVFDVASTTLLNIFEPNELDTLKIMDLPNQISAKINSASIETLVTRGIITGIDQTSDYYKSIKGLTLLQLINGTIS